MKHDLSSVIRCFSMALSTAALGALSVALMLALYDMPRTVNMDVLLLGGVLFVLANASELLSRRGVSMLFYLLACGAILYFGAEQVIARTAFIPGSNGFPIFFRVCIWSSGAACAYACHKEPGSNAFVRMSDTLILSIGGYMATLHSMHEALNMPILGLSLTALLLSMLVTASLRAGGESDSVIRGTGMGGYLVIGALLGACLLLAALILTASRGHVGGLVEAFLVVWSYVSKIAMQLLTMLGLFLAYLFGGQRMMQTQYAAQDNSMAYQVGPMEATQTAPQWVVYLVMGLIVALILAVIIAILWALRSAKFGHAKKKKIQHRITRTSKAGAAIRALIARIISLISFELHYRAHKHTPQGMYVFAMRTCRTKRIPRKRHESPGAYMRRLHGLLTAQGEKSQLDELARMLDSALYGGMQMKLERSQAEAFAAQIRTIAAAPLIKMPKSE